MCIKYRSDKFSHFIEIIHTDVTLFRENYVNRLCKTWTAIIKGQWINDRACGYTTSDRIA